MFHDKISLSFDVNFLGYWNMNENFDYPDRKIFYNFGYYSFKIGIKLGIGKK